MAVREFGISALFNESYTFLPFDVGEVTPIPNGSPGGTSINKAVVAGALTSFTSAVGNPPTSFRNGGMWHESQFSIDFQQFPSVPETSTINRVRMRVDISYGCTVSVNMSPNGEGYGPAGNARANIFLGFTNIADEEKFYEHSDLVNPLPLDGSANAGIGGPGALDWEVDYGEEGISYDTFLSIWETIRFHLYVEAAWEYGGNFATTEGNAVSGSATMSNWRFEVEFTDAPFTYTFAIVVPEEPVEEGTEIKIAPLDPNPIDLELIETLILVLPDGSEIEIEEWWFEFEYLIFEMPPLPGSPKFVTLKITSTQFSGSVILGTLITIFFAKAGGLYTIVTNKRLDTIYVNDDPGESVEVAFPAPFIDTGVVNG